MTRLASVCLATVLLLAPFHAAIAQEGGGLLGGLSGGLDNEPESGAAQPRTNAPSNAPAPSPAQAAPASFPALADCTARLSGLPFGTQEQTIAFVDQRLTFWDEQTFAAIVPFRTPQQAEYALKCFDKRLTVLRAFVTNTEDRRRAQETADAIRARWGAKVAGFLEPKEPESATDPWWQDADAALEMLARLDVELGKAARKTPGERRQLLAQARDQIDEFRETIKSVREAQDTFDDKDRAFWLRAMAWRARSAGAALDRLQRYDFGKDADAAYKHLTAPAEGDSASMSPIVVGDLAPMIERLRRLRESRGQLDPGAARDWSKLGQRQAVLEELYLVSYMAQTMEERIDAWQRDKAETFKLRLQLTHDIEIARGASEAESRAARDREWAEFREKQRQEKEAALPRWQALLSAQRSAGVLQGPRINAADQ